MQYVKKPLLFFTVCTRTANEPLYVRQRNSIHKSSLLSTLNSISDKKAVNICKNISGILLFTVLMLCIYMAWQTQLHTMSLLPDIKVHHNHPSCIECLTETLSSKKQICYLKCNIHASIVMTIWSSLQYPKRNINSIECWFSMQHYCRTTPIHVVGDVFPEVLPARARQYQLLLYQETLVRKSWAFTDGRVDLCSCKCHTMGV